MGSLKFEDRRKTESIQSCGQKIRGLDDKMVEERDSTLILDQIEAIDDDDLALIEEARQEAETVAGMERVTSGYGNAGSDVICVLRPKDIDVDYTNSLSDVKSFEDSSVDFQDISDVADSVTEEMQMKMEQLVKMLEDIF